MKTIELNLYSFNELSEEAKEKAIENWLSGAGNEDFYYDERIKSYNKAMEIYNQLESIENEISGARLVAYIENNFSHLWRNTNRISKHLIKYPELVTKKRIKNGCYFENSDYQYKYNCLKFRVSRIFETNNIDNCPLTGVCYDVDFMEPIINFMKNPSSKTTNIDLWEDMPSYESIYNRDMEDINSDEYVSEHLEANNYEFTEDGKIY